MNTHETVISLCQKASAVPDLEGVESLLRASRPAPIKLEANRYVLGDYIFDLMLELHSRPEAAALKIANTLQLSSAPHFVEHVVLRSGESLLVTLWKGCGGGLPQKIEDGDSITSKAAEGMRADLRKLSEASLEHPYFSRGLGNWYSSAKGERVYIWPWSPLRERGGRGAPQGDPSHDALASVLGRLVVS